jgi:hypoxia up-regulated 1
MTRSFPTKETHIIYDAGASSTRATLATFITINNATSIEIKAYGYDLSSGGNELSERLRKILTQQFEAKIKKSIFEDDKAKAKLWKEAERVKAVLSANAESTVTVIICEGLNDLNDLLTNDYS